MKTEESIRVLLSLYVRIEQNYDALTFFDRFLSENSLECESIPERSEYSIDEAITESLWFQIIILSCSFMEEWDEFLGVKTLNEDNQKIILLKKAVAPARKEIMKWKDIKNFRNEVIAHNLRNSKKEFSLEEMHCYNCPKSIYELFYLVKFLDEMVNIFRLFYQNEIQNIIAKAEYSLNRPKNKNEREFDELKESLGKVREQIAANLAPFQIN